ncbi:MAG: hypothetical protein EPO55_03485 [Reyranella sp.]|uniref:hypothetical protein n=1 Tax=Reyranella sp. TaxID=1929291 RepID=UPI0011FC12D0|nr:hypothetical protein [Reyranella sp.]TAJ42031.1 MAG: hypothetical protein EPO55_03485 [Reyranella sp.]
MRNLAILALAFLCNPALAQPQPRIVLDVAVLPAPGYKPAPGILPGRLAVGADGTHYVILNEVTEASEARVELIAMTSTGSEKVRTVLPLDLPIGPRGFAVASMGVIATRSGDTAVFVSGVKSTLFRLGTDGRIKKQTAISPPSAASTRYDPDGYYELRHYVPTADNAAVLAGGFGSGPYAWWLGKFSLDGVRLWQAGPGRGFPESVNAIGVRADGSWIVILEETQGEKFTLECFLDRYAADGRRLARARLAGIGCYTAAVLRDGSVVMNYTDSKPPRRELIFYDDSGKVKGRAAWPFDGTNWIIADGDGFAAIVTEKPDPYNARNVVRADASGSLRWKSPVGDVTEIARTPDGQIAALIWSEDGTRARLARYADP